MVQEGKIFVNRRDAGYEVGKLLEARYKDKNALVLGIPRGGVLVAYEVAKVLNGTLSVVIAKKLPHPLNEEFAIGAAAEDGSVYLGPAARNLSRHIIQHIINAQAEEIKSRIQRFRNGNPLPEMKNRIVAIVDDGIATGATIVPAIKLCRSKQAAKVIVASPVSGEKYVSDINTLADEVFVVRKPEHFHAVGQVYEDFHNLTDEEVIAALDSFEKESATRQSN